MIHINSKTSPPHVSSTMCNRRHKGMMQTSIILVLCACIGYGFYLHNLLQMKLKYVDSKAVRYQSQQKSLSSQLQVVYEDRARLEKAVQKAKGDLTKTKEDFDEETKKKDELLQQMMLEHNDKYNVLKEQYDAHKAKSEDAMYDMRQKKIKLDSLLREHEKLKKEHKELNENHEIKVQQINELKKSHEEDMENMKLQQGRLVQQVQEHMNKVNNVLAEKQQVFDSKQAVEEQLQRKIMDMNMLQNTLKMQHKSLNEHKDKGNQLKSLQYLLKAVPADAIDLNHPSLQQMAENDKNILLDHLGTRSQSLVAPNQNQAAHIPDSIKNVGQSQQKDAEKSWMENDNNNQNINNVGNLSNNGDLSNPPEEEAKQNVPVDQHQLSQQEEVFEDGSQKNQSGSIIPVVDICTLKPEPGPCLDNHMRYYYHPELKRCIRFSYSGCGGNRNNFMSPNACEDTCNDPAKRFIQMPISEEDQINILANKNEQANVKEEQIDEKQGLEGKLPEQEEEEDEDENELVHVNQEEKDYNNQDKNDNGLGVDNQNAANINQIGQDPNQGQEENQREDEQSEEERRAREEEERIRRQEEEVDADMEAAENNDGQLQGDTALDRQHGMDQQQQEMDNFDDNGMKNGIQQNQINAQIQDDPDHVDEEGDDYNEGENRGEIDEKNEDMVQVDMPPAAQVAAKEPEAVMNIPPGLNDDSLHMEDENQEDEYGEDENDDDPDKEKGPRVGDENNVQLMDRAHDGNIPLDYDHGNRDVGANLQEEDGNEDYNDEDEDQEDPDALRLLQDDRVRKDQKFIQMENVQRMKDQSLNFHRDM